MAIFLHVHSQKNGCSNIIYDNIVLETMNIPAIAVTSLGINPTNVLQEWHAYIRTMVQFHVLELIF